MRNAAPREGRDHATLLPCAGALAVVALAALAVELPARQAAAQSSPCTTIADDAERLACYDRALRAASPEPRAPAPAAQSPAPAAQSPAVESSPQPASAPPASPAPAVAAAPEPPRRDAGKETVTVVIVDVRTLPGRETVFTTEDGARWVQTDSQRVVGLPATPFDAELRAGALSSHFLVPKSGARGIRVRAVDR